MTALAWLAHAYTASGFVLAWCAAVAAIEHDHRAAFMYLWMQVAVDATDGWLARLVGVTERLPWFSGSKLDDLVDFLAYAFVPALIVWRALLVPSPWAGVVACAILLSSGFGFSRLDAKTPDHFFTGFPSYWNIVVLYLFVLGWPPSVNLLVLSALCLLVFVPVHFVYPSRTPNLRALTSVLGGAWAAMVLKMLWDYPAVSSSLVIASFVFPVYYIGLSGVLEWRRHGPGAPSMSRR